MKKDLDNKINDYIEKVENFKSEHKMNFLERFYLEHFVEGLNSLFFLLACCLYMFEMYDLAFLVFIFVIFNIFLISSSGSKYYKIKKYMRDLFNELFNDNDLMDLYKNNVKELARKLKTDKSLEIKIILPYPCTVDWPSFCFEIPFKEYHKTIIENIIKTLKLEITYYESKLYFKFLDTSYSFKECLEVEMFEFIKKEIGEVKTIDETSYNIARKKLGFVFSMSGNVNDKNILVDAVISDWPKDSKGYFVPYDDKIAENLIETIIEGHKNFSIEEHRNWLEKGKYIQYINMKMYFYKLGISYYSKYIKNDIQERIHGINSIINRIYEQEKIEIISYDKKELLIKLDGKLR